jgi:hypothetical protein
MFDSFITQVSSAARPDLRPYADAEILTVCFGLLVAELMLFSAIVAPMPFKMKKAYVGVCS